MAIRWSYALNQWKGGHDKFVLRREHERALQTVSVAGFEAVEITAGTARWDPLGRKDTMELHYGSVSNFKALLADCKVAAVSSYFFDPAQRIVEEGSLGRSVLQPQDHAPIANTLRQYGELLSDLGGDIVAVRALPSWQEDTPLSRDAIALAADCWNAAGQALASYGVRLALNVDCTSMLRTADDISTLLDACDPTTVGLSIDTADAVIAGFDPIALYRRFANRTWHLQFKDTRFIDTLEEYRLPNADHAMMMSGGARHIDRWFWEMGTKGGLVDFPAIYAALLENDYAGWIVVESDQSPAPATSTLLNGWYRTHVLHA